MIQLMKQLKSLSQNEQQMVHRLDLIQFQFEEIQNAELKLHEDEQLTEEKKKINNFEKIHDALQTSYNALNGEQHAWTGCHVAMNNLDEAASLDESLKNSSETVSNSYFLLEDAKSTIRDQLDSLDFDT